jgi:mannose-6-phosphate isomerase
MQRVKTRAEDNELLKHVNFAPTYPVVLSGDSLNINETIYPCPVQDFGLSKIALKAGESYTIVSNSIEMLLVMEGQVEIEGNLYNPGEVAMVNALQSLNILAKATAVLFKSFVP